MQLIATEPLGPRVVDAVDYSELFAAHSPPAWRMAQHLFNGSAWSFGTTRAHSLTAETPVMYEFSDGTYGVSASGDAVIDAALAALNSGRQS